MRKKNRGRATLAATLFGAIGIVAFAAPLRAADAFPAHAAANSSPQALWISDHLGFAEINGTQIRLAFGIQHFTSDGLTFDSTGNFWGTFCTGLDGTKFTGLIFELTRAQLRMIQSGVSVKPKVTFENPARPNTLLFDCPSALQFDANGNLWIANSGDSNHNSSIMKYAVDQLKTGGKVTPAAVFTSPEIGQIYDLALDGSGNLWLADDDFPPTGPGRGAVIELTSEQISATGPQIVTPNLVLIAVDDDSPETIAFDPAGNLWVAGFATRMLLFDAADLTGAGTISPVPIVTISAASLSEDRTSFTDPQGLAFDPKGNLWATSTEGTGASFPRGNISRFKPDQISTTGTPKPSLYLQPNRITKQPNRLTFAPLL